MKQSRTLGKVEGWLIASLMKQQGITSFQITEEDAPAVFTSRVIVEGDPEDDKPLIVTLLEDSTITTRNDK